MGYHTLTSIPQIYGLSVPLANILPVYHKNVPMIIQSLGSYGHVSSIYSLLAHSTSAHLG